MSRMEGSKRNVLIIKHGALGDFVLATGPMSAIRSHHEGDHIVLLTTKLFEAFAAQSYLFDEIWIDLKPGILQIRQFLRLISRLRSLTFDWVYDLQTSSRSNFYFHCFPSPKPNWSGISRGASHCHKSPDRVRMHTIERQVQQLRIAGISKVPLPNLSWVNADIRNFKLVKPYGVLVAGGSPHRPAKKWPSDRYNDLAMSLISRGIQPVMVGGNADREAAKPAIDVGALDLIGLTSISELVEIFRGASLAVGNDTGPMHIAGSVGCPGLVLFSGESDPELCAPRGALNLLRYDNLDRLSVEEVTGNIISENSL